MAQAILARNESTVARRYAWLVTEVADPTAAVPSWAITDATTTTDPSTWVNGSWGSWDATLMQATVYTPLIGGSGIAIDLSALGGTRQLLWCRYTVGSEVVLWQPAVLTVPT